VVSTVSTPLKNMKVSWDVYSRYMENVPNHQLDTVVWVISRLQANVDHGKDIGESERGVAVVLPKLGTR